MNINTLFEEKKTKKKDSAVMLEINDNGITVEYHDSSRYIKPFIEFISSIGFQAKLQYEHFSKYATIIINDILKVDIDASAATINSKNAFTRDLAVRKPDNRFILLKHSYTTDNYILKVFVNKEMNGDKLKQKLNQAIQEHIDKEQKYQNLQNQNTDNTIFVGKHYIFNDDLKSAIKYINIDKGRILFYLIDSSCICIDILGAFIFSQLHIDKVTTIEALVEMTADIQFRSDRLKNVADEITQHENIPVDIGVWAATTCNQYFYTNTMSTNYISDENNHK